MPYNKFLIQLASLKEAIDLMEFCLFPQGYESNLDPCTIRSILLEEATLMTNAVLDIPDENGIDPEYVDEAEFSDAFSKVGDELVKRRDWLSIVSLARVSFIEVLDLQGLVLIHIDQGESGGHRRLPQIRQRHQL